MDTPVDAIAGLQAPEGEKYQMMVLPDALSDFAARNAPLVSRLSQSFVQTQQPLSEDAVWELIASHYSSDWKAARDTLAAAETRLNDLMAPENMPLGLIGHALHSDETNAAARQHTMALADFTILNETLRGEGELDLLLRTALKHQRTIEQSLGISRAVAGIGNVFGTAATPETETPEAGRDFGKVSAKKPEPEGLSLSFRQMASTLIRKALAPPPRAAKVPGNTL